MNAPPKPADARAALLLALAGMAFLLSALLTRDASRVMAVVQGAGVLAFFAAAALQYRRARQAPPARPR